MLRFSQSEGIISHRDIVKHIGVRFRIKSDLPEWYTDEEIANYLLRYMLLSLAWVQYIL